MGAVASLDECTVLSEPMYGHYNRGARRQRESQLGLAKKKIVSSLPQSCLAIMLGAEPLQAGQLSRQLHQCNVYVGEPQAELHKFLLRSVPAYGALWLEYRGQPDRPGDDMYTLLAVCNVCPADAMGKSFSVTVTDEGLSC